MIGVAVPKFTVDTHLFRELGELLVGRDSTALVELIKNAYDADATRVTVFGEALDDLRNGKIVVVDNGIGMTASQFEDGFLRIASRLKETGDRRSPLFHRRYTGAKGIGRLAAHKLARNLIVESVPFNSQEDEQTYGVRARINWDAVERFQTLDQVDGGALALKKFEAPRHAKWGTSLTLQSLRRAWTATERARFFAEVQSFDVPDFLKQRLLKSLVGEPLLFSEPLVRQSDANGKDFTVTLEGEFAAGEEYWQLIAEVASWIIEIQARPSRKVEYAIAPTNATVQQNPAARQSRVSLDHPSPSHGPFFDCRILVREGRIKASQDQRVWASRSSGIRVYLEGFRVLPYGDPRDDWLGLDADYTRRARQLEVLSGWKLPKEMRSTADHDEGLLTLPNNNYFGAVFLVHEAAPTLRLVVNREGFVPDAGLETLTQLVRTGIDLCTRVRAAAAYSSRQQRKHARGTNAR
ncbi:MAG: ATP-binding protein [Candidatus Binataceae bacterium]